jgi:hypothetical protein
MHMSLIERLRIHLKDYAAAVEAAARIEQLEAALREIADMHALSQLPTAVNTARAALDQSSPQSAPVDRASHNSGERLPNSDVASSGADTRVLLPCPVCGGEAIHAVDVLKRTIIQPARQENDDVFKGFRGNNEA